MLEKLKQFKDKLFHRDVQLQRRSQLPTVAQAYRDMVELQRHPERMPITFERLYQMDLFASDPRFGLPEVPAATDDKPDAIAGKVNEEKNGLDVNSITLAGTTYEAERVAYRKYRWGEVNPGAGQIGLYSLCNDKGEFLYGVIADYRATEGKWKTLLTNLSNTPGGLMMQLAYDDRGYGRPFADLLKPQS